MATRLALHAIKRMVLRAQARATREELAKWEEYRAEMARRSHRKIGTTQKLFMAHPSRCVHGLTESAT